MRFFQSQFPKIILAIILVLPALSMSQIPPNRCAVAEARQFDFWIGDWDVFDKDGSLAGTNLIAPLYGQCGLHESWKAANMEGQSFNRYDTARGLWHQTWTDSSGGLLLLDGKFANGAMTLSDATLPGKKDAKKFSEISWTKLLDGSVRQHWRSTADGGATWKTVFDGKYVRSKRPQPGAAAAAPEAK